MLWIGCVLVLLTLDRLVGDVAARSFYFSSARGKDNRDIRAAQSPFTPWRSLAKASAVNLGPGDKIVLCRGDAWYHETLKVTGKGTPQSPAMVTSYPCRKDTPPDALPFLSGGIRLYGDNLRFHRWGRNPEVSVIDLSTALAEGEEVAYFGVYVNNEILYPARTPNVYNISDTWGYGEEVLCENGIPRRNRSTGTWDVQGGAAFSEMNYPPDHLTGARAVERRRLDHWAHNVVVGHWGEVVSYDPEADVSGGCVYFEGKLEFLDAPREFFFDAANRLLYVWPRPGQLLVNVDLITNKVRWTVQIGFGSANLVIETLHVEFSEMAIASMSEEDGDPDLAVVNITIRDCVLRRCFHGIRHTHPRGVNTFERNRLKWILGDAIAGFSPRNLEERMASIIAIGNRVHYVGYISGWAKGIGLYVSQAYNNVVGETGYVGIYCIYFSACVIRDNIVHDYMKALAEGGGILLVMGAQWGGWKIVQNNVVLDGWGNWGTQSGFPAESRYGGGGAPGIYVDGQETIRYLVSNNTVINPGGAGLFNKEAYNGSWLDNLCYSERASFPCMDFVTWFPQPYTEVIRNKFLATGMVLRFAVYGLHRSRGETINETHFQTTRWNSNLYCMRLSGASFDQGNQTSTATFSLFPIEPPSALQNVRPSDREGVFHLEAHQGITGDVTPFCDAKEREDLMLALTRQRDFVSEMKRMSDVSDRERDALLQRVVPGGFKPEYDAEGDLVGVTHTVVVKEKETDKTGPVAAVLIAIAFTLFFLVMAVSRCTKTLRVQQERNKHVQLQEKRRQTLLAASSEPQAKPWRERGIGRTEGNDRIQREDAAVGAIVSARAHSWYVPKRSILSPNGMQNNSPNGSQNGSQKPGSDQIGRFRVDWDNIGKEKIDTTRQHHGRRMTVLKETAMADLAQFKQKTPKEGTRKMESSDGEAKQRRENWDEGHKKGKKVEDKVEGEVKKEAKGREKEHGGKGKEEMKANEEVKEERGKKGVQENQGGGSAAKEEIQHASSTSQQDEGQLVIHHVEGTTSTHQQAGRDDNRDSIVALEDPQVLLPNKAVQGGGG
ncbi:hypothetical protein CBR_g24377 [Chara braunii]|uniref:Right handed beta helix domain-containing protein n=1 Tax=Chara braunii TaxID=69332 RepID=A0A388JMH4_CHABU|nr:hypothetical protein CBR_g24377 [Chara braunii]|eukprot:GBG59030.1 hypothetical protein CBR_g24377 [Chara braunii]